MKKRLVIGATLVALMLSASLFAISVFAAVSQTFGVNNRIIFVGSDLIEFTLAAEITGTTKDGDDSLKTTWNYSTDSDDNEDTKDWNIEESLVFDEEDKVLDPNASNRVSITYTFNIALSANSDKRVRAYISPASYDAASLIMNITGAVGSEITIEKGSSATLKLEVIPTIRFSEAKACNFSLVLEPIN